MSEDFEMFSISHIWLNGIKVEFKTKKMVFKFIEIPQETKEVATVLKYEVDAFYLSKIHLLFTWIVHILASRPFLSILNYIYLICMLKYC